MIPPMAGVQLLKCAGWILSPNWPWVGSLCSACRSEPQLE